jgi:PAS domain S-box-containing protein
MHGKISMKSLLQASRIALKALLIVVLAEGAVAPVLAHFGLERGFAGKLVDAVVLACISAPFLYLFVIRDIARSFLEREDLSRKAGEQERYIQVLDEKRELSRRLFSVVDNIPGAVYRGHRDWSISFIGAEGETLTGYVPEEFADGAILWKELIHPEDLERVRKEIRDAVRERSGVLQEEYRILRKDGSVRWVADRLQLIYGEGGDLAYVDGLLLDVTERRQSEDARREAEQTLTRLGLAVDQAAEAVVVTDTAGNIEYVNPAFERITGYSLNAGIVRAAPGRAFSGEAVRSDFPGDEGPGGPRREVMDRSGRRVGPGPPAG